MRKVPTRSARDRSHLSTVILYNYFTTVLLHRARNAGGKDDGAKAAPAASRRLRRTVSYITLHDITLHYIALHHITLHHITMRALSARGPHGHGRLHNGPGNDGLCLMMRVCGRWEYHNVCVWKIRRPAPGHGHLSAGPRAPA